MIFFFLFSEFSVIQPTDNVTLESELHKSKRTGSLALFFRKVYTLANLRLEHLCHGLGMSDETFKRKIWTVFEHVLKSHTDMMKVIRILPTHFLALFTKSAVCLQDRHMDQLLMCSMYIVWRIVFKKDFQNEKIFNKIINQYKKQPQAEKHVYECVLIQPKTAGAADIPATPPGTPSKYANNTEGGDKPNDLIKFYNAVFVKRLMSYMKNFVDNGAPPLSPLPKVKTHPPQSPMRKVSESHSVFIRPLKTNPQDEVCFNPKSPHRPLSYSFSRSPAKVQFLHNVEISEFY